MIRTLDIALSAALMLAGTGLFAMTFGDAFDVPTFGGDVGPAFAPRIFLSLWVVLAAFALFNAMRSEAGASERFFWGQLAAVVAISVATGWAMTEIGFVFSAIPGMALFLWVFRYRRPVTVSLLSIAVPLALWALFTHGFELLLPSSPSFHQF